MQDKNELIINATKWLGDANILTMDWDCQGMLIRLLMFSTQQAQTGYLPFNEQLIKKVLSNPSQEDWEARILPQLLSVLKVKKMEVDGIHGEYLYYPEYINMLNQKNGVEEKPLKKTRKKKNLENDVGAELVDEDIAFQGYSLDTIIKAKASTTILFEKQTEEVSSTIWDVGVSILMPQKKDEASCRKLLGRLIKLYGNQHVSAAIADISSKNLKAANMEAFLIGIVKQKVQTFEGETSGDGSKSSTTTTPTPAKKRPTQYGGDSRAITGRVVI